MTTNPTESKQNPSRTSLGSVLLRFFKADGFFIVVLFIVGACWFFYLAWLNPVPTADDVKTAVGELHFEETGSTGKGCPCFLIYIKKPQSQEIVSFVYVSQDIRDFVKALKPALDGKVVSAAWDEPASHSWQRRVLSIRDDRTQYLYFSQVVDEIIRLNYRCIGVGSIFLIFALGASINFIARFTKNPLFANLE